MLRPIIAQFYGKFFPLFAGTICLSFANTRARKRLLLFLKFSPLLNVWNSILLLSKLDKSRSNDRMNFEWTYDKSCTVRFVIFWDIKSIVTRTREHRDGSGIVDDREEIINDCEIDKSRPVARSTITFTAWSSRSLGWIEGPIVCKGCVPSRDVILCLSIHSTLSIPLSLKPNN